MKTLDQIAIEKGTDKSSKIHNYCIKYEKYFPFNRIDPIKILEIGVLGGGSIETWREYFPNATIVGIDIDPNCKQFEDKNRNIFIEIGSQDDSIFINQVCQKYGPFEMVLDDGSHQNHHVIRSFELIFGSVKSQGIYVVEDACCSYWKEYGGKYRDHKTMIEYFKGLIDDINFDGLILFGYPNVHARREDWLYQKSEEVGLNIRKDIESINFMNSIILITKR